MLEILDAEGLDEVKLNIRKYKTKKTQIVLYDTTRKIDDFLNTIKYRMGGEYENIPHFIISKRGEIYQLFDTNFYSNTFNDKNLDKRMIKIAIENLGWLSKNSISGFFCNWIGAPYRTEPYVKKWRNYFYWDIYTDDQYNAIIKLTEMICDKHNIPINYIPANYSFRKAPKFNGILCKSNFSDIYTDINPSFDFKKFVKNEENIK